MYYTNKSTNTTLTENEYKELMVREATNLYAEMTDEEKEELSFDDFLDRTYENETDFYLSDENGNRVTGE